MKGSRKTQSFRRMNKQTLVYPYDHGGGTRGKNTYYIVKDKFQNRSGKMVDGYSVKMRRGTQRQMRNFGNFRLMRDAKSFVLKLASQKKDLPRTFLKQLQTKGDYIPTANVSNQIKQKKKLPARKQQKKLPARKQQKKLPARKQQKKLPASKQQKPTSPKPESPEELLANYNRFFRTAPRSSEGKVIGGFRGVSKSALTKIKKDLRKHKKELAKLLYGDPIFSINGINFSIGTKNSGPSFNVESIPYNMKQGMGYIYFGFNNREKYNSATSTNPIVQKYLGLDTREDAAKGKIIQIIEILQNRFHESTYLAKLEKTYAYQVANKQTKEFLRKKAQAKAKYPFFFQIADLPIFISQIRTKHPSVAVALAKVYFGTNPGSAGNCPDTGLIQDIARNTGYKIVKQGKKEKKIQVKPTKAQINLVNKYIGPLSTYRTKPTLLDPKGKTYRFYQKVGIAFWRSTARNIDGRLQVKALIGDDMGVGKTVQGLGCIQLAMLDKGLPNPFPTLIISPGSPQSSWMKELREWLPNTNPIILKGKNLANNVKNYIQATRNPIILTTYASATKYQDLLATIDFKMLIMDESHAIKNKGSGRSRALRRLAFGVPMAVLLSGTPEDNQLIDLWAQMYILDPYKFQDINKFEAEFKVLKFDPKTKQMDSKLPHATRLPGNKFLFQSYNIQNGHSFIMDPPVGNTNALDCYMIRRLKSQILDLPPKVRKVEQQELTPQFKRLYEQYQKEAAEEIFADRIAKWAQDVSSDTRIRINSGMKPQDAFMAALEHNVETQEKIDYGKIGGTSALRVFNKLRRKSALLRLPTIINWVSDFYRNRFSPSSTKGKKGDTILIFAEHHNIIDLLQQELSQIRSKPLPGQKRGEQLVVKTFTGRTKDDDRRNIEKDLNAGKIDVLILNRAGNEGINLQRANYVLFAERYWTPGQEQQAEDRAHRSGQKNTVFVYYFNIPPWQSSQKDENGEYIWIDPIDNKINNIIQKKRANIKAHIGNQTYATETSTKRAITKEIMEQLSQRYKRNMANNKNKKAALRTALTNLGVKGVTV